MQSLLREIEGVGPIHTAFNYDEAFLLLEEEPDLVLLDIKLPDQNGMNLLKQIKDSEGKSEVVMLTNYVGEPYRRECRELGALHFFDKTNEFDKIPDMVKEFTVRNNSRLQDGTFHRCV